MKNKIAAGHAAALFTIIVWGTTFISTKVLLRSFTPVEILFYRFLLGFLILCVAAPRRLKLTDRRHELLFAGAGLTGLTLYYLMENIALTYTSATNVGIIISAAPFFTAIFSWRFLGAGRPKLQFFAGFVAAMAGIVLIGVNGSAALELNPLGDLLSLLAAFMWAIYSILMKKITTHGYNTIQVTRRVFFYGIILMIPFLFTLDFHLEPARFALPKNLFNMLFLSICASALCFVTWNYCVKVLGALKTSVYIYVVPVVTAVTSMIVLRETVNWVVALGMVLTMGGLFLSEAKLPARASAKKLPSAPAKCEQNQ